MTTFEVQRLKFDTPYCIRVDVVQPVADLDVARVRAALNETLDYRRRTPGATDAEVTGKLIDLLGELGKRRGYRRNVLASCRANHIVPCPTVTVADALREWFVTDPTFQETTQLTEKVGKSRSVDFPLKVRQLEVEVSAFIPPAAGSTAEEGQKAAQQLLKRIDDGDLRKDLDLVVDAAGDLSPEGKATRDAATALKTQATAALAANRACKPNEAPSLSAEQTKREQAIEKWRKDLNAAQDAVTKAALDRISQEQARLTEIATCRVFVRLAASGEQIAAQIEKHQQLTQTLTKARARMDAVLPTIIDGFPLLVSDGSQTELPSYTERGSFYISGDVGALMPVFPGEGVDFALYVGVNFYLDAVDKDVPLAVEDGFWKRFSLVGGITLNKVEDPSKSIVGLIGGQSLVAGVGWRVTDYLRLGTGVLLFDQKHKNPTVAETSLRAAPYFSLSIDSDVVGLVKDALGRGKQQVQ